MIQSLTAGGRRPIRRVSVSLSLVLSLLVSVLAVTPARSAPPGLVAAYAFDEGTGTSVTDASGNNNTGSVVGATWTPSGKSGNALSFNGTSSRVDIPNSASLQLTTGMTLEAWVNPTTVTQKWRDVIYKGNDNYYLAATSSSAGKPAGAATVGGANTKALGAGPLTVGTWTHLAATYDGTAVRLYVNGTQVGTKAVTGSITTSTNPLQIGGDSIYGQFFSGTIDEVRVYNTALDAGQITTDMATPIGSGGSSDTQAPTWSSSSPLSATAASSSQINLSWTAANDNVGVTSYRIERCQGTGCSTFTQIGTLTGNPPATTYPDTGLTASTPYSYRVRATDAVPNLSAYSNVATATTLSGGGGAPPGLVAAYAFDEGTGTSVTDASGNNNTGSVVGATWTPSGKSGNALSFNGTSSRVDIPNSASLQLTTGMTLEAWVNPTTVTQKWRDVIYKGNDNYYLAATSSSAGKPAGAATVGGANTKALGAGPLTVGTWTHLAATYDGTAVRLYVNGTQVGTKAVTGSITTSTNPLQIGGDSIYGQFFSGTIDEVRVYNTALDAGQITTDMATPIGSGGSSDTQAPTWSSSSPLSATAASSSQINLSWTAANDNVGVTSYRIERCQGTGCSTFTQIGTLTGNPPATTYPDTGLTASTPYSYRVRATDAVPNLSAYSNVATATTLSGGGGAPPGLVAAYAFDEGTGTSVTDASGNNNTGSVVGATWTPSGKSGNALSFNGTSSRVDIPNSASLQLTTGMTLEAWVNPTTVTQKWRDVIYKGNDNYYLAATSSSAGKPAGAATVGGANTKALGAGPLTVGTWTHLAATYDGTAVRLYVNGTQVGTKAVTGSITTSTNPLQIGGDSIYGQFFSGTIDEVRVYNTALDAGQITTDMATPIGSGGSSDTQAPTWSSSSPLSATAASSSQINLSWTAANDNVGVTSYRIERCQGTGCSTFTQIGTLTGNPPATTYPDTGLTASTPYSYRVRATDAVPNLSAYSNVATATTLSGGGGISGVFTYHNDVSRTGQNLQETVLTPTNVNPSTFGKLLTYGLDGLTYASPLYVANVNVPGKGVHNLVYVATEHDSVYAFDADGASSDPIWHDSFIDPAHGVTTMPAADTGETGTPDIPNEIGITSTPVIDPSTNTMYVVAKTKEVSGSTTSYVYRLHALDIATGAEKFGGPVVVNPGSVPGTGTGSVNGQLAFNPRHENQRTGLLLSNGRVYFGFSSHGDVEPFHGWVLGFNATTLAQVMVFCTTPNGDDGGVWMSGGGIATDSTGSLYFITGDGKFDADTTGGKDYGDSYIRLSTNGAVQDYFAPSDQLYLDENNRDLGAGEALLLPDQPGTHTHEMVSAGKGRTIYVVDRDNMGHFDANANHNVQTIQNVFAHANFSAPVYFNGRVYFSPSSESIQAFQLSNGVLSTSPTSTSSAVYDQRGGTLAVSANGNSNGILWALQSNNDILSTLHAYDPSNLAHELYNSDQAAGSRDALGAWKKFTVPTIANGKVFVATDSQLVIYGLLP